MLFADLDVCTDEELLRYSQISALPQADTFNVNSLRKWLSLQTADKRIQGPGAKTWGDVGKAVLPKPEPLSSRIWRLICSPLWAPVEERPEFDLVVPRAGTSVDGLARWVANEFVPFWQYLKDHGWKRASVDEEKAKQSKTTDSEMPTINSYREGPMLRFTSFIATIVACLLPTVAIAVLAQLHTTAQLLGIIAVFTAVFAGGLMMLVDSGTSWSKSSRLLLRKYSSLIVDLTANRFLVSLR